MHDTAESFPDLHSSMIASSTSSLSPKSSAQTITEGCWSQSHRYAPNFPCLLSWNRATCLAKRLECVKLASALDNSHESGSKLHALQTLREVRLIVKLSCEQYYPALFSSLPNKIR